MDKKKQIEAIKADIEVFENSTNLYFASDTRKTQIEIAISKNDRQVIINYLKQKLNDLEKESLQDE